MVATLLSATRYCCSLITSTKSLQHFHFIDTSAGLQTFKPSLLGLKGDVIVVLDDVVYRKEVSRLRGLVGGGEIQDNDISVVSFPGSPGSFKWEGVQGSFSPLTSVKRISQKKDYDIALVGAFRREKDKEMELQALRDEIQASMKLVRQREDEIQSLKMRLRFREAGIKRLETVASEKISAETHLLKEKEEHLKEIEVLRAQEDRNNEATRFAMENLQLKEEIRRHLLEALDWKFMHETDLVRVQSYQHSFCSPNLTGHAKFDAEAEGTLD
ncbi:hypothetical protein JHK86_010255 [Glycine max]|nr:hypothetical protein JHK86_010255 [Glycine max]